MRAPSRPLHCRQVPFAFFFFSRASSRSPACPAFPAFLVFLASAAIPCLYGAHQQGGIQEGSPSPLGTCLCCACLVRYCLAHLRRVSPPLSLSWLVITARPASCCCRGSVYKAPIGCLPIFSVLLGPQDIYLDLLDHLELQEQTQEPQIPKPIVFSSSIISLQLSSRQSSVSGPQSSHISTTLSFAHLGSFCKPLQPALRISHHSSFSKRRDC